MHGLKYLKVKLACKYLITFLCLFACIVCLFVCFVLFACLFCLFVCLYIQARIAQLVAYRLGTGEVLGSNPGKGENFSVKIKSHRQLVCFTIIIKMVSSASFHLNKVDEDLID